MLESIYIVLLGLILFIEVAREKLSKIDFLTLFNIYFVLMYPLPGFMLAADFNNAISELGLGISIYTNNLQTTLAIFVGYFVVLIGFYAKSAQKWAESIIIKERPNSTLIVFTYAGSLLLFACLSIFIYGLQYGGVLNALANTSLIRSQAVEGGSLVFFVRFTLFAILASYLLGSLAFMKDRKIALYSIFIFSVVAALIAITLTGGRAYFINYFLVFFIAYVVKSRKVPWAFIAIFGSLAVLFLFYGKVMFFSLTALPDGYDAVVKRFLDSIQQGSDYDFNFNSVMQNFQFPVYSLDVAFSKDYQLRWFVDFVYGLASLIPERLLGTASLKTIMEYNSEFIVGKNDVAIPTGFLAFGIYSLWWPGLVIVCFAYGWVGRYLQAVLYRHRNIFWMPFLYGAVAQMWMDILPSDPETFFQGYFASLTGVILLFALATRISIVHDRYV